MKTLLILSLFISALTVPASKKESKLRTLKNNAFQAKEKLRYRVTYGIMDAGEALLEVNEHPYKIKGRDVLHIKATGRTLGAFSMFYKVYDVFESYVDKNAFVPYKFKKNVSEGKYKAKSEFNFYPQNKVVYNKKGTRYTVPENVQDLISAFYYARLLDFKNAKKGQTFKMDIFLDGHLYPLKVKYLGKEQVKVRKGRFNCLKFAPLVEKGRYFKSEQDVQFWVSDDANKVPILVKAKIPVGTVKMHLVEWSGLKTELVKVKKS